jgi:hypothetical protein
MIQLFISPPISQKYNHKLKLCFSTILTASLPRASFALSQGDGLAHEFERTSVQRRVAGAPSPCLLPSTRRHGGFAAKVPHLSVQPAWRGPLGRARADLAPRVLALERPMDGRSARKLPPHRARAVMRPSRAPPHVLEARTPAPARWISLPSRTIVA